MRALAAYIMRGRLQAALVAVACAFLSVFLPPLSYVAGGAMALVALRHGGREALQVMGLALLGAAVLGFGLLGDPSRLLLLQGGFWLVVTGLALLLRLTVSLPLTLQGGALLGVVAVVATYLAVGDSAAAGPEVQALRDLLLAWAPRFTGLLASAVLFSVVVSLLLARWWQSLLYNPGGFRVEFHGLRLDRRLGLALVLLLAAGGFGGGPLAGFAADLAMPLLMAFALAGIGLVHALAARAPNSGFWLVGFYVLLVVLQPLALLVALAAVADSWLDIRRRTGRQA
jgi:hypothetical protein